MFASAGLNCKLYSWEDTGLQHHATFNPKPSSRIVNVSWCNDNSYMVLLQENEKPQILSFKDRNHIVPIHSITAMKDVSAVVFKHNTKRNLAMGNSSGEVVIYDTKMRVNSKIFPHLTPPVKELQFNCNDQQLGVLCNDSLLVFYDSLETDYNREYKHPAFCSTMKFHSTLPNVLAVGCRSGYVAVWDTNTSSKVLQHDKHSAEVTGIALAATGKLMLTCGKDYKICVADATTGDVAFTMNIHQAVTSVDLSSDDKLIAAGLEDGSVYLYDLRCHLQPLTCTKAHNGAVNVIAFENGPRESTNFNDVTSVLSSTSINETEQRDNKYDANQSSDLCTNGNNNGFILDESLSKDEAFERMKRELLKMVAVQMDDLGNQLAEHCAKFQAFINSEFESIHSAIRERWDIFNEGDMMQIVQAIDYTGTRSCSVKNAINRKINNN